MMCFDISICINKHVVWWPSDYVPDFFKTSPSKLYRQSPLSLLKHSLKYDGNDTAHKRASRVTPSGRLRGKELSMLVYHLYCHLFTTVYNLICSLVGLHKSTTTFKPPASCAGLSHADKTALTHQVQAIWLTPRDHCFHFTCQWL